MEQSEMLQMYGGFQESYSNDRDTLFAGLPPITVFTGRAAKIAAEERSKRRSKQGAMAPVTEQVRRQRNRMDDYSIQAGDLLERGRETEEKSTLLEREAEKNHHAVKKLVKDVQRGYVGEAEDSVSDCMQCISAKSCVAAKDCCWKWCCWCDCREFKE